MLSFPGRENLEIVLSHDAHRVVAKARVKGLLVPVEDFVNAQLMNDWRPVGGCRRLHQAAQHQKECKQPVREQFRHADLLL